MAHQRNENFTRRGFRPRKMFDVSDLNIKCCECGAEIKELPFVPDPTRLDKIYCRDCMRKRREIFRRKRQGS